MADWLAMISDENFEIKSKIYRTFQILSFKMT
jgi:hypothetical protein